MFFHLCDYRVINVSISNTVRENIDSVRHEQARILQMVYVRCHAQSVFVRFVDDCGIDFRWHLRILSPEIVYPNLDEVRLLGSLLRDFTAGLGRSLGTEHFCKSHCGGWSPGLL